MAEISPNPMTLTGMGDVVGVHTNKLGSITKYNLPKIVKSIEDFEVIG